MMSTYLNINVRVPLTGDALQSSKLQTSVLEAAEAFRESLSKISEHEFSAGIVKTKAQKAKTVSAAVADSAPPPHATQGVTQATDPVNTAEKAAAPPWAAQ